jgi:hypothetical protein
MPTKMSMQARACVDIADKVEPCPNKFILPMTDVSYQPLAGFETAARV